MAKPIIAIAFHDPAPDFLGHLQQVFGWNEAQAIEALGSYILSTRSGRSLRPEQERFDCNPSANPE